MNNSSHFFKDKPLFGLDIGSSTLKAIQINTSSKQPIVHGYGVGTFDSAAVKDGVIVDHKSIAKSIYGMFNHNIVGKIDTRRVVVSIPSNKTYTKFMTLPILKRKEIKQAVFSEAEQYISTPIEDLYIDYSEIKRSNDEIEILLMATPKKVIDSYVTLMDLLGLEAVAFESSSLATIRLFEQQNKSHDIPTVLIDFGTSSADITVYDKTIVVTSTITGGGQTLTDLIAKKLHISTAEAHIVKVKYGISKSKRQEDIIDAIQPELNTLIKEIRRMMRYHEERSHSQNKIEQIITMGGGANMPGLSTYLTDSLRLPVRTSDPWQQLKTGKVIAPSEIEKSLYATVAGLALVNPEDIFRD